MKNNFTVRFLLHNAVWNYQLYSENKESAIQNSLKDLDPESNNLSLFLSNEPIEITNGIYSEIHLIALLFSALIRQSPQNLYYIDLNAEDFISLNIKIRCNCNSSTFLKSTSFSKYHYEIFLTKEKRIKLADLIFNKIKHLPEQKLMRIKKNDMDKIKEYFKEKQILQQFNSDQFHEWIRN